MQRPLKRTCLLAISLLAAAGLFAQTKANFFFELPEGSSGFYTPSRVQFVNASNGTELAYVWTIDGEFFSDEEEPGWLFLEEGKFKVCLEVMGKEGEDQQCQVLQFFNPADSSGVLVDSGEL